MSFPIWKLPVISVLIITTEALILQKHIWAAKDKIRMWCVGRRKVGKHTFFKVFNIINI